MNHSAKITFLAVLLFQLTVSAGYSQSRNYYKEPTWTPRALLPYDDAIKNNFWPKSPAVNNSFNDPGFSESRLSKLPAPGVHPRVLMSPEDVESIRAKVALGDKAPKAFVGMWKRQSKIHNAFYALVTKDDVLGKELAADLVKKMNSLEPKLDMMDKQPDHENLWYLERSILASGEPDPPSEIWALLDYDYLSGWMSESEKETARRIIARITEHRISNFLAYPDHYMINNHQGFGMEYIRLMLLIEGEKGFNQELFNAAAHKGNAMLDWFLDDAGMCYESIKGWLNTSAMVAVGLRQRNLLKHDHLRAKMQFFKAALRWEDGSWKIRDEMRASAFHVIWMMHYYHPTDESIDLLYQSTFNSHSFLLNPADKWPDPVGISPELLLLYADNGITDKNGKSIDWENQDKINSLKLPITWTDNVRGYVETRNSWRKDDLHVGFVCKQDFFYGGHEGSENNRIILWKDGVNWIKDNNMLATKVTAFQNMLTVDGKGQHWPPAPGTWLGVQESTQGLVACGDGKDGYSYTKSMQVHPLTFPSGKLGYYTPFTEGNYDLSRDIQLAFNPRTVKFNDGFAHTDYGPWSGETRLVEGYRQWNTMQQAYRTVQVARGANPYVLVVDDACKDGQVHNFDWNISVPLDVDLAEAITPEIVFQNTDPSAERMGDIILGKSSANRSDRSSKKVEYDKGEPLCLIRVLWRNAEYGFTVPRFEKMQGYNQVTIPARSTSPEFRVLIYPYKHGEALPKTTWNKDRTELTVEIKGQKDVYHFGQADGGRTVLSMERGGAEVLNSAAQPARPVLFVRGERFDINDLRYTRDENKVPTYLIDKSENIQLIRPVAPAVIRYTLDGSEPTEKSLLYEGTIAINKTCDLKAIVVDPNWVCGPKKSLTLTTHLVVKEPEKGLIAAPVNSKSGLQVRVYEINTKLYNDKGFFEASHIMLPNLSNEKPILSTSVNAFVLPQVTPTQVLEQQCKGFYRFSGLFYAKERGVYQFDVNSCGPVTLDFGKQTAIESIGVYHQNQAHRKGEVVLEKGWQNIELVICDPLFWNINSVDPMPLEVSYSLNGGAKQTVSNSELCYLADGAISAQPEVKWHEALDNKLRLEPGFVMQTFDRTGKRRDNDFLDVEGAHAISTIKTKELESSESRNLVRSFSGYFYAPLAGEYKFQLVGKVGEGAFLGSKQASCQNQLKVGDEVVVQRGVYGRNPSGHVALKKGWHPISLRFGSSETTCKVLLPDGQTIILTGDNVNRSSEVLVELEGAVVKKNPVEIYDKVKVALSFPSTSKIAIYYTLDGTVPTNKSLLYTNAFAVDKTSKLMAAAFEVDQMISSPVTVDFNKVNVPQLGSMGNVNFDNWNGKGGDYEVKGNFQIWLANSCKIAEGMNGKALDVQTSTAKPGVALDVNVSRGLSNAGLRIHHFSMLDNALTVSLWIKTSELNGSLFGKEGFNAFGKRYRTLSCALNNGKIIANPGKLAGGKLEPNVWQHIVLTADESQMSLYLNGEKVASGLGTKEISTDALDFFVDHNVVLSKLQFFDHALETAEVSRLYEFEKKAK